MFQQGPSGGRASQRSTSEVVCGMRARTTQELELSQQHAGPSTSEPASASLPQPSERQVCARKQTSLIVLRQSKTVFS
jgi:hypothetical protein